MPPKVNPLRHFDLEVVPGYDTPARPSNEQQIDDARALMAQGAHKVLTLSAVNDIEPLSLLIPELARITRIGRNRLGRLILGPCVLYPDTASGPVVPQNSVAVWQIRPPQTTKS